MKRKKGGGDASFWPATEGQETPDRGVSRREFVGLAAASILFGQINRPALASESKNGIPYRTLGRSREKVSLIGLGGFSLGKKGGPQERDPHFLTGLGKGVNFLVHLWG